ncbi:polyketide cyclase/dehydrase/lipid transport protein [Umezawaea tangerina]|uniref:Polyketide cyclase/dehydrase/lipid transport protein n=2 Tax=Umezawaea tangerina TaxID=84725 RepID=A0A2T0SPC5_9PSEU|nr:polyketide cyclase/dehydrase/lipid transport protein [Umezawaea tangerina]
MYHMVQRVDATAETTASPERVYALVRDGATWPSWSTLDSFELERPGETEREGVGAIRVFRTNRFPKPVVSREEIIELVPDRRLGYALLSGLAVRDYRAYVDLEPVGGGTRIRWHSSFRPVVPGTGWLYRRALQQIMTRCARGLAEAAAGNS